MSWFRSPPGECPRRRPQAAEWPAPGELHERFLPSSGDNISGHAQRHRTFVPVCVPAPRGMMEAAAILPCISYNRAMPTLLIADDHPLFRAALRGAALEAAPDTVACE